MPEACGQPISAKEKRELPKLRHKDYYAVIAVHQPQKCETGLPKFGNVCALLIWDGMFPNHEFG